MPFLELKSASEGMSVENEKLALTKMKLLEHLMSVEIKLLVNSCFVPNSMNRVGTSVLQYSQGRGFEPIVFIILGGISMSVVSSPIIMNKCLIYWA